MNRKRGRPKKEIDFELVEKLTNIFCTGEEIAYILGIDYDTLNARIKEKFGYSFSKYQEIHSAKGKMSLRRKQFEVALGGNVTMLIWLGKQYLGQKDQSVVGFEIEKPDIDFVDMNDDELNEYINKLLSKVDRKNNNFKK